MIDTFRMTCPKKNLGFNIFIVPPTYLLNGATIEMGYQRLTVTKIYGIVRHVLPRITYSLIKYLVRTAEGSQ